MGDQEQYLSSSWSSAITGDHVAEIQVNNFACGGVAISVVVCHMIADGTAFIIFIQNNAYPMEATLMALTMPLLRSSRCTGRSIVFDASVIASLKVKATSSSVPTPTRVEVVSALLVKCIMAAFKAKSGIEKPTFYTHAMNLRRKATPPFLESSMGNFIRLAGVLCTDDENMELAYTVRKLREVKMKIDDDFVKDLCIDSSDEREQVFPNTIMLMDTKCSSGIEARVRLDKEDITVLEQDKELLVFASLDPSPIKV
ncbi:acyltransferase Pun1-like [Juglans microcarpa x Juglans regia]|uniref:acyltransferase Pun1-like n=1 Tax=Juglans microcarpa x Juglans regia TaxID=2249226 RepID=UPI001B7DE7F2|nr:acyltransferase Pun1-like [Juglans microcarpa x Juglans regia]